MSRLSECMAKARVPTEDMSEIREHANAANDERAGVEKYLAGLHDSLEDLRAQLADQGHDLSVRRWTPPRKEVPPAPAEPVAAATPERVIEEPHGRETAGGKSPEESVAPISPAAGPTHEGPEARQANVGAGEKSIPPEEPPAKAAEAPENTENAPKPAGAEPEHGAKEAGPDLVDVRGKKAPEVREDYRGPGGNAPIKAAADARLAGASPRVQRGAENIIRRLHMQANLDAGKNKAAAERGGRGKTPLTHDEVHEIQDFINWIGPHLFHDVGLRMREVDGPNGRFGFGTSVVEIYRRAIESGQFTHTMVHELWHSLSRSLPVMDRNAVIREYVRAREKWLNQNPWARPFADTSRRMLVADGDKGTARYGDVAHPDGGELKGQLIGADAKDWYDLHGPHSKFAAPTDAYTVQRHESGNVARVRLNWTRENYRFKDADEYFAETMADKSFDYREVQDAKARSVLAHAKAIFDRMVSGLKRLFGQDATGRIFEGFTKQEYKPVGRFEGEPISGNRNPESRAGPAAESTKGEGEEAKAPPVEDKRPLDRATTMLKDIVEKHVPALLDIRDGIKMALHPISTGSDVARATAKDFASALRASRYEWTRLDDLLQRNFTPEQRRKMWEAADEQSVLEQQGKPTKGKGLDRLTPKERAAVDGLQATAAETLKIARKLGMIEGQGLPSYVPRMIVDMTTGKAVKSKSGESSSSLDGIGANLRTTTKQLLHRQYLTTAETEKAAQQKFGDNVGVVRDIRTLALATAKLQDAISGRSLVNKIRQIGRQTGDNTVAEGAIPHPTTYRWFTLDHPALQTWRPRMRDGEPVKDSKGEMVFEKVPIYIRGDFEGPMRAVLAQKEGTIYRALMALKGRVMSVVMYNPLIHNGVIYGRALSAMPGKVAFGKIYFEGNAAKKDPSQMREAIDAGLVPIGARFGFQDISSIAEEPNITPGRSWTAQLLSAIPGLIKPEAGLATRRAIDKFGDIWHNTLLWDRVADLQMGLYTNFRDHLIDKGTDPATAQKLAAHLANRYAGAIPVEAMSAGAKKLANIALFSRSFTMGNLGAMKDALVGLPSDVRAQIERDSGKVIADAANSFMRRKSAAMIAVDLGLNILAQSALASGIAILAGRSSLGDEAEGYVRRLQALLQRGKENALSLLNPLEDLHSLTPMAENEPGKENRIYIGRAADGSAMYMRLPLGKVPEEFEGWMTKPLEQLKAKLSTFVRPLIQTFTNDQGFGRPVYNPYDKTPGSNIRAIGNIVKLFIGEQVPLQFIESVKNALSGEGDTKANRLALGGQLLGLTVSKGAPGGPEMGEYYAGKREHDVEVQLAMPGIRQLIRNGQRAEAIEKMTELGIPPKTQGSYIRSTLTPRRAPSPGQLAAQRRYLTPEQQARMRNARERDVAEANSP